ncbi:MAG: TPM domain-containing protein [Thermoanaerobaculia bacterium]
MKRFFDRIDHDRLVAAIAAAEKTSSGEIRVHVHHRRVADPRKEGEKVFEKLGMTKTAHRNGVLIFVAPRSRNFAILGDSGIHRECGDDFWQKAAEDLSAHFHDGKFTDGLVTTIEELGRVLAAHFPPEEGKRNELSDDIDES